MKIPWIDLILDPRPFDLSAEGAPEEVVCAAYLLDGNFDGYQRYVARLGDESITPSRESLAGALVGMYMGADDVLDRLDRVRATSTDDLEVVAAAIVESVLLSDLDRPDVAVTLLRGVTPELPRPAHDLVKLQLSFRLAEAGSFSAANKEVAEVSGEAHSSIGVIAKHNAAQFRWFSGDLSADRLPVRSDVPALARIDGHAEEALLHYVASTFAAFFKSPFTRTFAFGVEDRTANGLTRALFRSECMGDWSAAIRWRGALGRHLTASSAGRSGPSSRRGFDLLRRAHQSKELGDAARVFVQIGPLEPVRESIARLTEIPWFPAELRSILVLLAQSGPLLDTSLADALLDRLLDSEEVATSLVPVSGWVTSEYVRALGALAGRVSPARTGSVRDLAWRLANRVPEPMLHQSLPHVIHAIDWSQVAEVEARTWLGYLDKSLDPPTDRLFVALAVARELVQRYPTEVVASLTSAYKSRGNPLIGSALAQLDTGLPPEVLEGLGRSFAGAAAQIRSNAAKGSYGLGGPSVGPLLARLSTAGSETAFSAALELLLDPKVAIDERVAVANAFSRLADRLPDSMRRRLAEVLPLRSPEFELPLGGTSDDVALASAELSMALEPSMAPRSVDSLFRMVGADDPAVRHELASLLFRERDSVPDDIWLPLVLSLSVDAQPEVRAQASFDLAAGLARAAMSPAVLARVRTLIASDGELVPLATWRGLAASVRAGYRPPLDIVRAAQASAADHPAIRVRAAAAEVAGATSATP